MDRIHPPSNTFETASVTSSQPQEKLHDHVGFVNLEPKEMTCPNCHKHVTTYLTYKSGGDSWSWCCCCILMGCVLGCCLLPFCMDRFKDINHNCPHCHSQIAHFARHDPSGHRRV